MKRENNKIVDEGIKTLRRENNKSVEEEGIKIKRGRVGKALSFVLTHDLILMRFLHILFMR